MVLAWLLKAQKQQITHSNAIKSFEQYSKTRIRVELPRSSTAQLIINFLSGLRIHFTPEVCNKVTTRAVAHRRAEQRNQAPNGRERISEDREHDVEAKVPHGGYRRRRGRRLPNQTTKVRKRRLQARHRVRRLATGRRSFVLSRGLSVFRKESGGDLLNTWHDTILKESGGEEVKFLLYRF